MVFLAYILAGLFLVAGDEARQCVKRGMHWKVQIGPRMVVLVYACIGLTLAVATACCVRKHKTRLSGEKNPPDAPPLPIEAWGVPPPVVYVPPPPLMRGMHAQRQADGIKSSASDGEASTRASSREASRRSSR